METPTKEELDKSVEKAKKLWPKAFGGDGTHPHITPEDGEKLNRTFRRKDHLWAQAIGQAKHTPKKEINHGLSNRKAHQQ